MPAKSGPASSLIHVAIVESIAVIRSVTNALCAAESKEFNRVIRTLQKQKIRRFIIDLTTCTSISSEGLGAIAACWHYCHDQHKGQMGVALPTNTGNETTNLFEISGLQRTIGSALQQNVRDAIHYVKTFSPAIV